MDIHEAGGPKRLQAAGVNAAIVGGRVRVTDPDGRIFYVCDTPTRAQPASEATHTHRTYVQVQFIRSRCTAPTLIQLSRITRPCAV